LLNHEIIVQPSATAVNPLRLATLCDEKDKEKKWLADL
jgi:hypothetical protein